MENGSDVKKKTQEKLLLTLCLGASALLLVRNGETERFVFEHLGFCAERIVPSLFLFLVFSDVICSSPSFLRFCRRIPFFGTELSLLALSVLGGFPLGARVCASLYEGGKLKKEEAEYLLCFSNNASASFVVGFVGQNAFGSRELGFKLLCLQTVGAVVCAAVFKLILFPKGERGAIKGAELRGQGKGFVRAVSDGAVSMLGICSFIVVFGVLGALVCETFPQLSSPLLRGFFEFSGGISLCAEQGGKSAVTHCAMLLAWSGLCVHCQVAAAVGGKLSLKPYFLSKLLQCALMGAFSRLLL